MQKEESEEHRRYKENRRSEDWRALCRAWCRRRRFGLSRNRPFRRLQPRLNLLERAAPLGIKMQAFARNPAERLRNAYRRSGIAVRSGAGSLLKSNVLRQR